MKALRSAPVHPLLLMALAAVPFPAAAADSDGETHLVFEGQVTVTVEVVRPAPTTAPVLPLAAAKALRYDTDHPEPLSASLPTLEVVAGVLRANPGVALRIEAHTDDVGPASANQELSLRRAAWVQRWLTEQGVSAERLSATGYGASRPVAPNDSEEGRQLNRRVDFVLASR